MLIRDDSPIKIRKKHKKIKSSSNKKWFDKECRLRKPSNQKHRDPLNANLRKIYTTVSTECKTMLCRKRTEYYNSKVTELEESTENPDKQRFW